MGSRKLLNNVCKLLEQTQEGLSVDQVFLADLKRSIEQEDLKTRRKPSTFYKPSSMNCLRGMYFQATGTDVEETTNGYCNIGICNSGKDIHNRIQDYVLGMKSNGIDCEYIDVETFVKSRNLNDLEIIEKYGHETKLLHKKLKMHFLTDGIIRYKGKYYILEIKTEISNKWNSRKGVDPKHFKQGICYSLAFGIEDVIFLYISRDTLDMRTFLFTPSDEMKMELVNQIDECERYVAMKTVPPMPDTFDERNCRYCGYKSICKGA